jgi:nucleotide-binding universal stress UspA family protein
MPSNIGASIILKRATICMIQIKAAKAQSDYSVYGSGKFSPHYAKRGAQHMLKDILVHIPTDQRAKPIIDCAVSLAQAFDAHLDGAARIYRSFNPAIAIGASAAAMAIATQYQPDMELAAGTLDQFELAAREAGLRHGMRTICDDPSLVLRKAAELSRFYSLVVVAQPDSSKSSYDDALPEAVLFQSGRPILLVPYIHQGPLKTDHVLVCWDGGSPAARAVHDAIPLLRKATSVEILTVDGGDNIAENPPEVLKDHLLRHGIYANIYRIPSSTTSICDTILSLAADLSIDLIVMGGYGHSRIREYVLGGVTRGIFETLTVPALISH